MRVAAVLVRWRRMALLELHTAAVGVRHPRRPESAACGNGVPGALDQNVIEAGFKILHKLTFGRLGHETQIRAHIRVLRDVAENRNRT